MTVLSGEYVYVCIRCNTDGWGTDPVMVAAGWELHRVRSPEPVALCPECVVSLAEKRAKTAEARP